MNSKYTNVNLEGPTRLRIDINKEIFFYYRDDKQRKRGLWWNGMEGNGDA